MVKTKDSKAKLQVVASPSQFSFFQLLLFVLATGSFALNISIIYGLIPLRGKQISGPKVTWDSLLPYLRTSCWPLL